MPFIEVAETHWKLSHAGADPIHEARSASAVRRVITPQATTAYLKVTSSEAGDLATAAARREREFYLTVAPALGRLAPLLLDSMDTEEGVAILLEDVGEPQASSSWGPRAWTSLAHAMVHVHEATAPDYAAFCHESELTKALTSPDWEMIETFWSPSMPDLSALAARIQHLHTGHVAGSESFTHGDLHTANAFMRPGTYEACILDWQQCGFGSAMADLAFVNVRMAPTGDVAPPDFLETYIHERGIDAAQARLETVNAELATYIYMWPPFAQFNTSEGVARVRNRATALAQWLKAEVS